MGLFKRVRIRLVLTNTAVFSIILVLICGILYVFTRERTFQQVDQELHMAARPIERVAFDPAAAPPDFNHSKTKDFPTVSRFGQLPTTYLVWSNKATLVKQFPDGTFPSAESAVLAKYLDEEHPFTVNVQGHAFRVLDVPVPAAHSPVFPAGGTVQVVRNVDDSLNQLTLLWWLIVATIGMGLLLSTLAGLFLAGRALIPINRAWERQQTFVSDASHELRTPLAVIQAQAELMLRHPTHTVEQEAKNVATIYEESRRMTKLVESLLTLARADSNQSELTLQVVSLSKLVESLSDIFTLLCEQQSLQFQLSLEDGVEMKGDADRLRQLLLILFDNAMKYTPAGGTIGVTCQKRANMVELELSDTGAGIEAADLPHIFERFYRGDKARSRVTGGAGLGLSIAQWIVQAHQGKIAVNSTVGKGTTFKVTLPTRLS